MSTAGMSPGDDGRVIPQYRHQQLEQLTRMFGDDPELQAASPRERSLLDGVELRHIRVTSGPTFTPTPGTLDETRAKGKLFWMPAKLPHEQMLGSSYGDNPRALYIEITYGSLSGCRHPRTPSTCDALRAEIAKRGAALGVYRVTIDKSPEEWTLHTLKDLAVLMDALLPTADDDNEWSEFVVDAGRLFERGISVQRLARSSGGGTFYRCSARILACQQIRVFEEWCRAFSRGFLPGDKAPTYTTHPMNKIDHLATPKPATTARQAPAETDDDDDLDAFEKTARRTLHGEKAIPNTSRTSCDARTPAPNADLDLLELISLYGRMSGSDRELLVRTARTFVATRRD